MCPRGHLNASWSPTVENRNTAVIKIQFSLKESQPCSSRVHCPRAPRRMLTVHRQGHSLALHAARACETSAAYPADSARRAAIDGPLSQGTRAFGLRRAQYIGAANTALQHVLTAGAINFGRMGNWHMEKPLARTRV
jgi:hypothetical protein